MKYPSIRGMLHTIPAPRMGHRPVVKAAMVCTLFLLFSLTAFAQDPNFYLYLGFGQSNMAGAGAIETQDKTVDSRFQMMSTTDCSGQSRLFGKWYPAIPPLWGCPSGGLGPCDYFGRTMVQKLPAGIKIGVIVIGIPGCDIRLFDKTGFKGFDTYNNVPAKYNGSAYAWLMELAKLAQKDGVIKGFLMHQGETMPDASKWCGQVKAVYDSLIADLKLDPSKTPLLAGELLYTNQGGSCGGANVTVDKLPGVIPNSYVVSANGLPGKDQFHFNSAGERAFGARYADTMLMVMQKNTNSKPTIPPARQTIHPVTYSNGAVWITLQESYAYTITGLNGAAMESGSGKGARSVGSSIGSGAYLLSIAGKTVRFTEKIIRR